MALAARLPGTTLTERVNGVCWLEVALVVNQLADVDTENPMPEDPEALAMVAVCAAGVACPWV